MRSFKSSWVHCMCVLSIAVMKVSTHFRLWLQKTISSFSLSLDHFDFRDIFNFKFCCHKKWWNLYFFNLLNKIYIWTEISTMIEIISVDSIYGPRKKLLTQNYFTTFFNMKQIILLIEYKSIVIFAVYIYTHCLEPAGYAVKSYTYAQTAA